MLLYIVKVTTVANSQLNVVPIVLLEDDVVQLSVVKKNTCKFKASYKIIMHFKPEILMSIVSVRLVAEHETVR